MSQDMTWMHRVLGLLAARADTGMFEGLPLQRFEMATQHELAFRTLQSGLYVGKIVMCVVSRTVDGADDPHIVMGDTDSLTLITTSRWLTRCPSSHARLAQRQARRRNGSRAGRTACHRHRMVRHARGEHETTGTA